MSNKIRVKVNLPEFTYQDDKGYHTVVGYGDVPRDNQEVQIALQKKLIEEVTIESPENSDNEDKKRKSRRSSSKDKEE